MIRTVELAAPAKINLDLRVTGTRRDGYHELRTLFQALELHDTVTLTRRPGPLVVRSRSRRVPRDRQNIGWTAAQALWTALGRGGPPVGVAVSIRKRIPLCGGLGGGSSNAAAVLRGLAILWDAPRAVGGMRSLKKLALSIGADVPFLLTGGLALGTGRGDSIRRLPALPPLWVVLAVPHFGVSTPDAYRWFDNFPSAVRNDELLPRRWRRRLDALQNHLEAPVVERHPEIGDCILRLRQLGAAHTAMTGSGSTVFGLFHGQELAEAARRRLRAPGWHTVLTRTLDREEFRGLARPRLGK